MFHQPIVSIAKLRTATSLLAAACSLLVAVPSARAEVPAYVPFQGFLTDELGQPIDGLTDITFSIYDRETGGTPLFTETRTIVVEQGFLNLFIGSVNTLDPAVLDNPATYLGIKINTDGEMIDRTRLASVPYAFFADQCKNADTLDGMAADAFAPAAPSWSSIADRPSGLDDGDDNTTYSAVGGLTLDGENRFSIATQGIVTSMIAAGTITGTELAANTITAGNLASNAIDSSEIASAAVNLDELADLPAGSELVVQASIAKQNSYDLEAAAFTPSAAARCLVTVSAFAEHDGGAGQPITFRVLSVHDGTTLVGSPLTSSLPVAGQVLTTAASTSATWMVSAASTAFGCRISVPNDAAYNGGTASCNVSWVCF